MLMSEYTAPLLVRLGHVLNATFVQIGRDHVPDGHGNIRCCECCQLRCVVLRRSDLDRPDALGNRRCDFFGMT